MIHDAKIEITCEHCDNLIEYEMPFVYSDYSGNHGHYSSNDADVESFLEKENWIIGNDNHFCCEECQNNFIG